MWEYLFLVYYNSYKPEITINGERLESSTDCECEDEKINLYDVVNDLGEEGWELFITETSAITNETRLIFKRQYSPEYQRKHTLQTVPICC